MIMIKIPWKFIMDTVNIKIYKKLHFKKCLNISQWGKYLDQLI